jgi:prepilin-type N-terminal cleavage/methylation domain-containing protein
MKRKNGITIVMKKNKTGFTLFELLVSISIIAILTAVVSVSYSVAQKKARDVKRRQDMEMVQKAAEQYYSLSNSYSYPSSNNAPTDWTAGTEVILNMFPTDPKAIGWTAYSYSIGTTYCACAAVENASNNSCSFSSGDQPYFCVKSQQ